ncbi:hypothetical protein Psfp_02927 [Pelotomaculum sp. FP]|uniref:CsxC family protein n=1 Tax=Pelotomaculum sp. FP TaxID=261474 RepID=UPI001066B14A|nr:hypothetical protein [Pelotomaculum sp. FP]TEB14424.1 hypothetical protein Psfp_02927 [Pelotomaculum sp. FP]
MAVKNDQVEALACPKPLQACATVASETVPLCDSDPVTPTVVNTTNFVIGKIPVVLANLDVQIDLFSTITLPTPALEIKRIKKRLKITQCRLIQNTNKLFLEGFVRKNIEYATTEQCVSTNSVCGVIRHCVLDAPFRCVTEIEEFISPPVDALPSFNTEFEYLATTPLPTTDFPEKDSLLAGDLSEFNQESSEFFNELPFCELISSTITEFDEFINRVPITGGPFEERTFTEFDEKSVIRLVFKVLQNQQVCIPPSTVCTC